MYAQMLNAVEQFFPESGILQDDGVHTGELERAEQDTSGYPLQRVDTGVSSLVGHNNGERPGGLVLVIDGGALTHVRLVFSLGVRSPFGLITNVRTGARRR